MNTSPTLSDQFKTSDMLQLPDKKTLEEFLLRQLREQEG